MRKIEPYTVVTRAPDGQLVTHAGIRAVNADHAIRRAKQARDERDHGEHGIRAYVTVSVTPGEPAPLHRQVLVAVLIDHQRLTIGKCSCGWGEAPGELGHSFAEHVADAYERANRAASPEPVPTPDIHWAIRELLKAGEIVGLDPREMLAGALADLDSGP